MIAQVGMAVNRVAAMPITLREITMGNMAWVTGVAQTARGAVTPHCDAHRPTTTSTHKPHPGLPQGEGVHHNLLKHNGNELPPLGRALKNYHYFHFIGVVRRHYRAFTRRSGYDVW